MDESTQDQEPNAGLTYRIYCATCDRSVNFDPSSMAESNRPIGARFVCRVCGGRGQCIAAPDTRWGLGGWRPYGGA